MGLRLNFNACVAFALLAIAAHVQPGWAIKCWVCTSTMSKDCGDPMNATEHNRNFHTRDCDGTIPQSSYGYNEKNVCKKIVQRENGQLVIVRSCAIPNPDEREITNGPCGPHAATQSQVTIESCHICNSDYCNGANSISGIQMFQACAIALLTCVLSPSIRSFF